MEYLADNFFNKSIPFSNSLIYSCMKQKLGLLWFFFLGFSFSLFSQIQIGQGSGTIRNLPIKTHYD